MTEVKLITNEICENESRLLSDLSVKMNNKKSLGTQSDRMLT